MHLKLAWSRMQNGLGKNNLVQCTMMTKKYSNIPLRQYCYRAAVPLVFFCGQQYLFERLDVLPPAVHVRHGAEHELDENLVVRLVELHVKGEVRREAVERDAGREAPGAGVVHVQAVRVGDAAGRRKQKNGCHNYLTIQIRLWGTFILLAAVAGGNVSV